MKRQPPTNCKLCRHLTSYRECVVLRELQSDCFVYRLEQKHTPEWWDNYSKLPSVEEFEEEMARRQAVTEETEEDKARLARLRAILEGSC